MTEKSEAEQRAEAEAEKKQSAKRRHINLTTFLMEEGIAEGVTAVGLDLAIGEGIREGNLTKIIPVTSAAEKFTIENGEIKIGLTLDTKTGKPINPQKYRGDYVIFNIGEFDAWYTGVYLPNLGRKSASSNSEKSTADILRMSEEELEVYLETLEKKRAKARASVAKSTKKQK